MLKVMHGGTELRQQLAAEPANGGGLYPGAAGTLDHDPVGSPTFYLGNKSPPLENGLFFGPNACHGGFMAERPQVGPCAIQRSLSSQALGQLMSSSTLHPAWQKTVSFKPCFGMSLEIPITETEFNDATSEQFSMRKVFSAGDLQRVCTGHDFGSPPFHDNSIIGAHRPITRYSAEERKERVQRYRSKRNHRNFSKKITYACRKTLADSRPRVRGRFARNEEEQSESSTNMPWNCIPDDDDDEESWIHMLDDISVVPFT